MNVHEYTYSLGASIFPTQNVCFEWEDVLKVFVNHFGNLLGLVDLVVPLHDPRSLFTKKLDGTKAVSMVRKVK